MTEKPHTKILTICTGNRCRSVTLAGMINATPHCEARSAGTNPVRTGTAVTEAALRWADTTVVFEAYHVEWIKMAFPKLCKKLRILNFDIEDRYPPFDPALIELLKDHASRHLGLKLGVPDNANALYEEDLKQNGPFYASLR